MISQNSSEWRKQVIWASNKLFKNNEVIPVTTYVRKDQASDSLFRISKNNNKVLDIESIWFGVFGKFALFLKSHNSSGEIWLDNLGSIKEQIRKQAEWAKLRDVPWKAMKKNQLILKRIESKISFFDSKYEPLIQIADFISGITFAASEGDDSFIKNHLDDITAHGERTFRLLKIE